jgi:chromosome segregation ATPase
VSGWNKRWIVINDAKMAYYKEQNDPAVVQTFDLAAITQISKTPESYPKDYKEGAFSFDVQEQKEIKTYFFAAASSQEKELVLRTIVDWRKWTAQAKKMAAVDVPALQKQLAEAHHTTEALTQQLEKLRAETTAPKESAGTHNEDMDVLAESLEEERAKNSRLEEQLEEERLQMADLKKQFLEQKRQLSNVRADEEEEDPLDFFKKK